MSIPTVAPEDSSPLASECFRQIHVVIPPRPQSRPSSPVYFRHLLPQLIMHLPISPSTLHPSEPPTRPPFPSVRSWRTPRGCLEHCRCWHALACVNGDRA